MGQKCLILKQFLNPIFCLYPYLPNLNSECTNRSLLKTMWKLSRNFVDSSTLNLSLSRNKTITLVVPGLMKQPQTRLTTPSRFHRNYNNKHNEIMTSSLSTYLHNIYIMTCPGYLRDPEPPLQQRQAQKQQEVAQSEPRIALSRGRDTGAAPPRGGYSIAIIFGCESKA